MGKIPAHLYQAGRATPLIGIIARKVEWESARVIVFCALGKFSSPSLYMSIQTLLRCNVEDEHAEKVHTFGRNMTLVHVSVSIIFPVAFVEVVFPKPERDRSFSTEAQRHRENNGIPENSVSPSG